MRRLGAAAAATLLVVLGLALATGWSSGETREARPPAGPQVREGAARRRVPYSFRRVASGLVLPLHLAAPRGEPARLYVVEQAGRIRVLERGKPRVEPFLDIRPLVQSGVEQGLLSVAFHPRYAENRRFYVDYTDLAGDTRIVEYRSDGETALPDTRRELFRLEDPYSNHNGGNLVFGPDGRLYAGMGDGGGGGDPGNRSQNPATFFGKLLAFDVDRPDAPPEQVARGLRNPWRFSFDRGTGDLYIGDVGQNAYEEIDFTPRRSPGLENYGWDVYEGRSRFERKRPSGGRLVFPIVQYSRRLGISVTGGFVYRGSTVPSARGRYFYGDFGSGRIWSLRVVRGKAQDVRLERFRVGALASFGEDAAGELYAVSLHGGIFKLVD
ncbi:MAG: PQQ-dependent sugar dehydrogenase [Actinobacteria bacterium]|nr:PQQ-dependent sugar dehydrogenase [Actinomycetota bacterium]